MPHNGCAMRMARRRGVRRSGSPPRVAARRRRCASTRARSADRGRSRASARLRLGVPHAPGALRRGALPAHDPLRPADELSRRAASRSGRRSSTSRWPLPARLAHGAGAPRRRGRARRGVGARRPRGAARSCSRACSAGALYGPAGRRRRRALPRGLPGAHPLDAVRAHRPARRPSRSAACSSLLLFLASREDPTRPATPRARPRPGAALALAVLTWQGAIYWGAIFALALVLECVLTRRRRPARRRLDARRCPPSLDRRRDGRAGSAGSRRPLTYVSFGFFQPLFLAALCGGTRGRSTSRRAPRGGARRARDRSAARARRARRRRRDAPLRAATSRAGLVNGVGYVAGTTHEVAGDGGLRLLSEGLAEGHLRGPAAARRRPGLAARAALGRLLPRPARRPRSGPRGRGAATRPGVHVALAIWGAVTLFLALSQRLNVYYAAPLAALALHRERRASRRARSGTRARGAAPAARGAAGIAARAADGAGPRGRARGRPRRRAPTSSTTLERMRAELPHAIDAYDPGLLGPPPVPAGARARRRRSSRRGRSATSSSTRPSCRSSPTTSATASSTRSASSSPSSEDEALAIARRHRARWIVATDLAPRMNDYASLPRPAAAPPARGRRRPRPDAGLLRDDAVAPLRLRRRGRGAAGRRRSRRSRTFRLLFHSQSAIRRGGRWIPRWNVFEISAE